MKYTPQILARANPPITKSGTIDKIQFNFTLLDDDPKVERLPLDRQYIYVANTTQTASDLTTQL